jgi:hypothetical protein
MPHPTHATAARLLMLIAALVLLSTPPLSATAQGTPYTTPDGTLQLTLPDGWRVQNDRDAVLVIVNHALEPDGGLTRGLITVRVRLPGAVDPTLDTPLAALQAFAAEPAMQATARGVIDRLDFNGREVLRLRTIREPDYIAAYSFFVDGRLLLVWGRTNGTLLASTEAELHALVGSIRPVNVASAAPGPADTAAPPTRTPVPTLGPNVVDVVGGLRVEVQWLTPLPPLDATAAPTEQVLSLVRLPENAALLSTRLQTIELDLATGEVLNTSTDVTVAPSGRGLLVGLGPLTTDTDGTIIAVNAARDGLLRFDPLTLQQIGVAPLRGVPAGAVPVTMNVAPDATFGLLSIFPDDNAQVTVYLAPPNVNTRTLTVTSTPEGFRAGLAALVTEPGGEALLIDPALRAVRYTAWIDRRFENELDVPNITRSLRFRPAAAYSPERELFVLTTDGLFVYDSLGALLAFVEGTKSPDDTTPFVAGELPPRGVLLPLGAREVLIVGYTATAGVALRVLLRWG